MRKRLSFTDMWAFIECPLQFLFRTQRARRRPAGVHEVVGDATHIAAADSEADREAQIAGHLKRLPEDKRQEAEERIRSLVATADEMSEAADVSDAQPEKQLRWRDPETGWELMAKPDEIGMVEERKRAVMQITDLKTAYRLREKHKRQLYFFGLVATLARGYDKAIKLVVRLLGSRTEKTFWYSPRATASALNRVRRVIAQIEAAEKTGNFEARTGWHCQRCPYRVLCPVGEAHVAAMARRQSPVRARFHTV